MMNHLFAEIAAHLDVTVLAVLKISFKAAVLVPIIFALLWLGRKWMTPSWRYVLLTIVLLRLAIPSLPESSVSYYNLFEPKQTIDIAPSIPVAPAAANPAPVSVATDAAVPPATNVATTSSRPKITAATIANAITNIWLAGFLILGGWTAYTCLRFRLRLRSSRPVTDDRTIGILNACRQRMKVSRRIRILELEGLGSPALFGIFRPRLLFPSDFIASVSDEALQSVFLHEFAHLKRRDVLVNWIMTVFQVIHWFNPLVWLAFARMRAERELACDARVLACLGRDESLSYGRMLLDLMERQTLLRPAGLAALVGVIEPAADMKRRLELIARGHVRSPWRARFASFAVLGVIGIFGLSDPAPATLESTVKMQVATLPEPALPAVPQGQKSVALPKARLLVHVILYSRDGGPCDVIGVPIQWPADKGRQFSFQRGNANITFALRTVEASTVEPVMGVRLKRSPYLHVVCTTNLAFSSAAGGGQFTFYDRQSGIGGSAMCNNQSICMVVKLLDKDDPLTEIPIGRWIREHWAGLLESELSFIRTDDELAPWKKLAGPELTMPNHDLYWADYKKKMDELGWMDVRGIEIKSESLMDFDTQRTVTESKKDPWPDGVDAHWNHDAKLWEIRPDANIHVMHLTSTGSGVFPMLEEANSVLNKLDTDGAPNENKAAEIRKLKAPFMIRTDKGDVYCVLGGGFGTSGSPFGTIYTYGFNVYRLNRK